MYICMCNPFTDKDVKEHLDQHKTERLRTESVYYCCSDGQEFNCGQCSDTLRKMVDHHNNSVTITQISKDMCNARKTVTENA